MLNESAASLEVHAENPVSFMKILIQLKAARLIISSLIALDHIELPLKIA